MRTIILAPAALLVLAQAPVPARSLAPCEGIEAEQIIGTFNANGMRLNGPTCPILIAVAARGFDSSTAAIGAGFPGFCTGYISSVVDGYAGIQTFTVDVWQTSDGVLRIVPLVEFR
jgi:hypothetical protein